MIEHPALAGIFLAGDVNAGLLIKPPVGKSEVIGDLAGLLQDDSVWLEHGIDITSHASGVVSQGAIAAPPTTNTSATTPLRAKRSPGAREGSLDLCPAKQNVARFGYAASRSLADR